VERKTFFIDRSEGDSVWFGELKKEEGRGLLSGTGSSQCVDKEKCDQKELLSLRFL